MATYNFIDRTGQVFDRLTVTGRAPNKKGRTMWECVCTCGNTTTIRGEHLRNNATQSCGCIKQEQRTKHDMSRSTEYSTWQGVKDRCINENNKYYKDYGGRGITVCDRWLESFDNFFADMGKKPRGLTIDRIDNNAGYSPGNCRWATRKQQVDNRRNSILLTIDDETRCLKDWCRHLGVNYTTALSRIKKQGMTVKQALKLE